MQPIPETLEAVDELDPLAGDGDLLEQLNRKAARAREIAPHCVGVSVASRELGATFTLVATSDEIAALDGLQYLDGGPCVDAVERGEGIATNAEDLLSERRWRLLGRASAAAGIQSTLTFPIVEDDQVVGSVNLYGSTEDAFTGRHPELAVVFRAWAPGAVINADMSFSTRTAAEHAPELLRKQARVEAAIGILAADESIDVETARQRLQEAAQRAGIPLVQLAEVLISLRVD